MSEAIEKRLDQVQQELDAMIYEANDLSQEEYERIRVHLTSVGYAATLATITHPLTFAKTLFQFGYEPFPLTPGKQYIFFGNDVYFLPNVFTYLKNIYQISGLKAIFRGWDANIVSTITHSLGIFCASFYLDKYYPEIGGALENVNKEENELTHHESLRVHVRSAIRNSIALTAATLVSQPFSVIMVREIAQYIGGENKYPNVILSLFRIGREEGPAGLFSGLVPQLLGGYVTIWTMTAISYGVLRTIKNVEDKDPHDETVQKTCRDIKYVVKHLAPLLTKTLSYPLNVVSTIMAVSGSGLLVSMLPYSPVFSHWSDAHSYLKPYGLTRGSRVFLRQQTGPISVGSDRLLYASNKHFV